MSKFTLSDEVRATHGPKAPLLAIIGGALTLLSGLLSWSADPSVLEDVTVRFWPVGAQIYVMVMGVAAIVLGLLLRKRPLWMSPGRGLRILGWTIVVFALAMALFGVGYSTGALANLNEGLFVTLIGGVLGALIYDSLLGKALLRADESARQLTSQQGVDPEYNVRQ